jgi:hypothetical protein
MTVRKSVLAVDTRGVRVPGRGSATVQLHSLSVALCQDPGAGLVNDEAGFEVSSRKETCGPALLRYDGRISDCRFLKWAAAVAIQ